MNNYDEFVLPIIRDREILRKKFYGYKRSLEVVGNCVQTRQYLREFRQNIIELMNEGNNLLLERMRNGGGNSRRN